MFERFQNLKIDRPLNIIDLETTGVDPEHDRIVEFAVLRAKPDGDVRVTGSHINPGIPIPPAATAVHGIRDEDVAQSPRFHEIAEPLFELLSQGDLCGYNLKKFDLPLLACEFGRCWLDFQWTGRTIIDVFEIFRKQEPRDLANAMQFYCGRPPEDAHSAHGDVDTTAFVLDAQLARYPDLPRTVRDLHERFAGIDVMGRFRREDDAILFNFGKHAGRSLREVAQESPDYLQWMVEGNFLDDVKEIVRKALTEADNV